MKRRQFIKLLGSAAVAGPSSAQCQPTAGLPIIGVLSPISSTAAARNVDALREGLRELGYIEGRNVVMELRFADGAVERLPELAAELVGVKPAVIVAGSPSAVAARTEIARLPAIYGFRDFAFAGGLMAYGASLADIYRRKAGLIVKILGGTNPADIPIARPTRFELLINLSAAKALGITISPSLLARADEVIE
jgi:ABC-type uncharacterized transport system substrate-binding protein